MKKRLKIKSKKYNKKLFKSSSGVKSKGNSMRPHQRGGWRM